MSERRKLKQRLRQLADIRGIMDAMKNLALAEIFKLRSRLENQQGMVHDLELMAADFLRDHPYDNAPQNGEAEIWVLFGSERGFCGDFNEALINHLQPLPATPGAAARYILVGGRLTRRYQNYLTVPAHVIDGADVAEEVSSMLNRIIDRIRQLQAQTLSVRLHVLYHDVDAGQVRSLQLLPPFLHLNRPVYSSGSQPLLHLPPMEFFSILVDEYLYCVLHQIAFTSLLAENNKRIQHMTGALQRLDERTKALARQYHVHRQEEITEEIEVILLNAAN